MESTRRDSSTERPIKTITRRITVYQGSWSRGCRGIFLLRGKLIWTRYCDSSIGRTRYWIFRKFCLLILALLIILSLTLCLQLLRTHRRSHLLPPLQILWRWNCARIRPTMLRFTAIQFTTNPSLATGKLFRSVPQHKNTLLKICGAVLDIRSMSRLITGKLLKL